MNNNISISIIMPVYNSGFFLKPAIESILSQSFKNFELILVDDGSTDGSSELCDEYLYKDNRIKVIHQQNGGICNARNNALKIAKGEYIAFSDHDDEYLPDFLAIAYSSAKENNSDIVKVEKTSVILRDGKIIKKIENKLMNSNYQSDNIVDIFFQLYFNKLFSTIWDGIYKREFISKHNISFDEFYKKGGEDFDFMLQLISHKPNLNTVHKKGYMHYIRIGFSTSTQISSDNLYIRRESKRIIETINSLNIDLEKNQLEYSLLYLIEIIAPLIEKLAKNKKHIKYELRKKEIKSIEKEIGYYSWIKNQNIISIYKLFPKYSILYFFYKNGLYRICTMLYLLK